MSQTYPQYPYTQFPDTVDPTILFADLDLTTKVYADQYYTYLNSGDLVNANKVRIDHPELESVIIDSKKLNQIADSISALQKFFHDEIQKWIFNVSTYVGEWSRTVKYTKFNVVSYAFEGAIQFYQGNSLDIPISTLPTNEDYWTCVTLRGEKGDPGIGLAYGGLWNELTRYQADQFVVCDNAFWLCIAANENSKPRKNNTNWELMLQVSADLFTYDNSNSQIQSEYIQGAIDELDHNMRLVRYATFTVDGWTGDGPYTQVLLIDGITDIDVPHITPYHPESTTVNEDDEIDLAAACVDYVYTGNGFITATCKEDKPQHDIPIMIKGV